MSHKLAVMAGSFLRCSLQRAHSDASRSQIGYLVDLKGGVDTVARGQDLTHLIGVDGIKATAE